MEHRLCVVGLGYVGLALVKATSARGIPTIGVDSNSDVVSNLNGNLSKQNAISSIDLDDMKNNGFVAFNKIPNNSCNVYLICVPTPLTQEGKAELKYIIDAATSISKVLKKDDLIVLESTTYPGTTEEVVLPILEQSGMKAGVDFFLAFSPERVDPGNTRYSIVNTPKVVSGYSKNCTERAINFYGKFVQTLKIAKGLKEAELAKLIENSYRLVNISFVNELAQYAKALGIDVWDSIDCASSKPFGFQAFWPSAGAGGHCIPVDPVYLSGIVQERLGVEFRMIQTAKDINEKMSNYIAMRVKNLLSLAELTHQPRVLILGVSYKPNSSDVRDSPATGVIESLNTLGYNVEYFDPYVPTFKSKSLLGNTLDSIANPEAQVENYDVVIILQAHEQILSSGWLLSAKRILDATGSLRAIESDSIELL
jgi:UDP-N-acetyl-D-glucosamine dehydrogenase